MHVIRAMHVPECHLACMKRCAKHFRGRRYPVLPPNPHTTNTPSASMMTGCFDNTSCTAWSKTVEEVEQGTRYSGKWRLPVGSCGKLRHMPDRAPQHFAVRQACNESVLVLRCHAWEAQATHCEACAVDSYAGTMLNVLQAAVWKADCEL